MKKKIIILALLFLCLYVNFTHANSNWFQDGNTDYGSVRDPFYHSYASSNLGVENESYNYCELPLSDFTPIGADFDNDNETEILISDDNVLMIYDFSCILEYSITLSNTLTAMPVITTEYNENGIPEIIFLTGGGFYIYEYSPISHNFNNIYSKTGFTDTPHDYLTCLNTIVGNMRCLTVDITRDAVYSFTPATDSFNKDGAQLSQNAVANNNDYVGWSNSITIYPNSEYRAPFCMQYSGSTIYCNMIEYDGSRDLGATISLNNGVAVASIDSITSNIAYLGTNLQDNFKVFTTISTNSKTVSKAFIHSRTGIQLFSLSGNSYSNWAVGDVDKDGDNDACIIANGGGQSLMSCYDSAFSLILQLKVHSGFNSSEKYNNFVMADFNATNDYMCFGLASGIYCPDNSSGIINNSAFMKHIISTNYDAGAYGYLQTGYPITLQSTQIGLSSHSLIYSDRTRAFILSSTQTASFCGDGICNIGENQFNCPTDCIINATPPSIGDQNLTGEGCTKNSDCESGLCINGFCALKPATYECTLNSECLSGVCTNGKCTKPSLFQSIDASKDELVGDDENSNTLISLLIVIFGTAGIIASTRTRTSVIAGVGFAFISLIFFAIIGWLSAFYLLGLLFTGIVGLIIVFVVKGASD